MFATMRRPSILPLLLVLGSLSLLTGAGACGGNVVVDGEQGSGVGGAPSTSASSSSTGTTATGGFGGAVPPGPTTGTGVGPACTTCAEHLVDLEMGLPSTLGPCTAEATSAEDDLSSCVCAGACKTACVGNACIGEPASGPCLACIDASCASQIATCKSN